jgi:glycosyltransferase involved in cell wall biosynthesis
MYSIPLISIIIPVYNVEEYLSKCIESVLIQDYINIELLLINDGSTDASGIICDKYSLLDNRIKVFHQRNKGVSSARNVGIDNATGIYICFIDSDDWVEKDYISSLTKEVNSTTDLIIGGLLKFKDNKGFFSGNSFKEIVFNNNDIYKAFTEIELYNYGGPTSKLYRLSIIRNHNIKFNPHMNYAEDFHFLLRYLLYVRSLKFISSQSYYYRISNNASLSKQIGSFDKERFVFIKIKDCLDQIYKKFKFPINEGAIFYGRSLMTYILRIVNSIYNNNLTRKNRLALLKSVYKDYYSIISLISKVYQPYCLHDRIQNILLSFKSLYLCDIYHIIIIFLLKK